MHIKISRYLALLFVKEVPKLILFVCSQQRPKLIILIGSLEETVPIVQMNRAWRGACMNTFVQNDDVQWTTIKSSTI